MPRKANINLKDRFGNLVVIRLRGKTDKGERIWLCVCDCGNTCERITSRLPLGGWCGCRRGKNVKKVVHGMWRSPEFKAWMAMQDRCYRKTNDSYEHYHGQGITVWKKWRGPAGFALFFAHVGLRPSSRHSLDRYPNKNGNYEPGNVRWATPEEQQRNRNNNTLLTLNGVTRTQVEWSEITGIKHTTLGERKKRGWSDEDTLTKPVNKHVRRVA